MGQVIERVTWHTPSEKLPPAGQIVVASISGKAWNVTYDHTFSLAEWYDDYFGWTLTDNTEMTDFVVHALCDLEPYGGKS